MADTVVPAYVHPKDVAFSWHHSWMELVGWDISHRQRFAQHGWIAMQCGTDGLVGARNKVATQFLDETGGDWLFWIDTDMGFSPDTVERLLAVADPVERPIVGGLCFASREIASDNMGGHRVTPWPTIYDYDPKGFLPRLGYQREAVVRCSGTGSACLLIHRSALERIREKFGTWYDKVKLPDDNIVSEDLSFCMRAGSLGIPVHVHTGVKTTHLKPRWLGEDAFLQESYPPPALERVAVVVPVLGRPHHAEPFMRTLQSTTSLATVYAVATEGDDETIKAWDAEGATILTVDDPGTFSRKVNHGYRHTTEPWLFFVGDDVLFRDGWYNRALRAAGDRFHLVAVNDLGNLAVMAGHHATHPLMRRSWIDEQGASWDGPGVVAHEGYRHWYVDKEWSTVAGSAGVMIGAPDAVVEHLHWQFGKSEMDDTYRKGQASNDRDQRLWDRRCKEYA